MSIQLNLSKSVLQGMALFVSARAGSKDPNPNSAIHLRYIDPSTLRMACTNGGQTAYLRLHADSEQLKNFYWPEDEIEKTLSIHLNSQAMGAIAKMGKNIILSSELLSCTIRGEGDVDGTSVKVPRLQGRQIALFYDMDNAQPAKQEDCVARGQLVLNSNILHRISQAAKLIGYGGPQIVNLANIGRNQGVTIGSDENFWVFFPAESTVPPAGAGLPPYWLTGNQGDAALDDILDNISEIVQEDEEAAEEEQQAQLEFPDEHAPSTVVVGDDEEIDEEPVDDGSGDEEFDDASIPEEAAAVLSAMSEEQLDGLLPKRGEGDPDFDTPPIDPDVKTCATACALFNPISVLEGIPQGTCVLNGQFKAGNTPVCGQEAIEV